MSDMLYTFANNDYFLPPSTLGASKAIAQVLTELLPADWQLVPYNIWLGAAPAEDQTPEQGFKIHLSTTRADMIQLLRAALPLCIARQCAFKVISRYDLATHMASKSVSRGAAGKFVTIYPPFRSRVCGVNGRTASSHSRSARSLHSVRSALP
ncbi:MAG: hypothetical protein U5L02_04865 [Rheinheimera sp.]|nr:hypothetical protein [Rheinheimera sp.]